MIKIVRFSVYIKNATQVDVANNWFDKERDW